MGLELEHDIGDTSKKNQGDSSTGGSEKNRFAVFLDGTRLAGLQGGVEDASIDALGHEIGGRNGERCYRTSKPSQNRRPDKPPTDACECCEGGSVQRRGDLETTLRMLQATGQEGTSQNKERVGENGAEQLCNVVVRFSMITVG